MDIYTKFKIITTLLIAIAMVIIVIYVFAMQKTDEYGCDAIRHRVIILVITVIMLLTIPILINKMGDFDKKDAEAVKRYEKAVDNGYKVYYNGHSASGDAIGITKGTLGNYDIIYDDDKKIVKITKRDKSDWYPVFIPIFYR